MPVIEVKHLHKRYGDKVAVDDVSFSVERGEIFGILGPNGAGKTTTVECLEGLRTPDGGELSVLGLDPRHDRAELRQRVGVQLQESRLQDKLRVGELLDLYAAFYRTPADQDRLLATLGLTEHRNTAYKKLSGGQQQRLSIALALVGSPEVAVLDELTTGLDPQARRDTWGLIETVRAQGVTILLVTHFMEEAERLCDRIAVIDRGRTVAVDTPAGLIRRVSSGVTVTFRPSAPIAAEDLAGVPGLGSIGIQDGLCTVTGRGNLAHEVSSALAARSVVPLSLNIVQADLESAFVALTGKES
jgi:ABC-2 type transport system ATP-binding protein